VSVKSVVVRKTTHHVASVEARGVRTGGGKLAKTLQLALRDEERSGGLRLPQALPVAIISIQDVTTPSTN
jgi:hypothetical protein